MSDREDRVDAAIAQFMQAADEGRPIGVSEFLQQHADLADDLREFLQDQAAFRSVTSGLRQTLSGLAVPSKNSDLVWRPEDELPRVFGNFELQRIIGRGGMGTVYAARCNVVSEEFRATECAIKVLHPWLVLETQARERFEREAQTTQRLQHPHIVPLIGSGCVQELPFLQLELIDGPSLDHALRDTQGDLTRCALLPGTDGLSRWKSLLLEFAGIADALQHAHDNGVLHRDVKPSNLLLTSHGRLLIGDFGLARWLEQPRLTQSGEAVGSPTYMSPEQLASCSASLPIDHRTDVYSLGATIFEALTGRPPFVASAREQLLASIQRDDSPTMRSLNDAIPEEWDAVISKALSKSPNDRFLSAAEFAAELRRCAAGQHPLTLTRSRWKRDWVRSRDWLLNHGRAVLATVVVLIITWSFLARRQEIAQQQAFDAALVIALTGDLKATEAAIERAQSVGVATTNLDLLRGQVAYHRGDYDRAIEHLEAASSHQPRVAALALQASAHLAAGSWEPYESLLERTQSLTAVTAEDFLFRGQAEIYLDADRAVTSLDAAIQRRDTPLARLVRAEARWNRAFDRSDVTTATAAVSDAFIARDLLPDHPAALVESLHAHHIKALLLAESHQSPDAELAAAQQDFEALRKFRHLPSVLHNQVLFLIERGQEAEAFELLKQAVGWESISPHKPQSDDADSISTNPHSTAATFQDDGLIANDLALAFWRRGQLASAIKILKQRRGPLTSNEEFLLVLLSHESGDKAAAEHAYDQISERYQSGVTAYFRPSLLLLLGDLERATRESQQLRRTLKPLPLRGEFYSQLLAFNAGEITETELLERASASRWDRCESLFFIGLRNQAQGNPAQAKQAFEQSLATRCVGFLAWNWSHALLQRQSIRERSPH